MDIVHVVEGTPLGTGGAIRLAMDVCTQDHVFVFNGDTILDLEILSLERRWQENRHPIVVGRCQTLHVMGGLLSMVNVSVALQRRE